MASKKTPFHPSYFVLLEKEYEAEDALLTFAKKRDSRLLLVTQSFHQALDEQVNRLCLATKHVTAIHMLRKDGGAALSQALICLRNTGATHAISLTDIALLDAVTAACKSNPEALLLNTAEEILAFPLIQTSSILQKAELSRGAVFETEFLLHWRRRKLPVQTLPIPGTTERSFWEKLAVTGAKIRFYLQAPKQKRCWVEPNIRV